MDKLRCYENESGFYIDYIFQDKNFRKCLRISEDNDYFAFCLFSPDIEMLDTEVINIDKNNLIFLPLQKLMEDKSYIEILEEGSDEGKSIIFKKNDSSINLIFNLTKIPTNTTSVSITNIRLASPSVNFGQFSSIIEDFKNKLHNSLLEIQSKIQEHSM